MPLNLDTALPINATIDALEIDSFAADLARLEMIVGYTQYAAGVPIKQSVHIISGLDFNAAITRANQVAVAATPTIDVYGAIKQTLYESIIAATGLSGTVA